MIPAEFAHRVDDLVHLSQGHPVHLLVELMEVRSYLLIVVGIVFVVALVEHGQDRFAVSEVRWICFDMSFQRFKTGIHNNIPPLKFVVCYLGLLEIATVISAKLLLGGGLFCRRAGTNKTKETNIVLLVRTCIHSEFANSGHPKMRARLRTQTAFTSTRQHHRTESVFGAVVLHMDRASDLVEMLIFLESRI